MRRTMTAVGLGLALTAALAGCGDDEKDAGDAASGETSASASADESESSSESASAEEPTATDEPAETTAPVVTVVDAGDGPGQLLELELEEGHHETSVMRMRQSMTITGMGSQDVPEIAMTLGTSVLDVTDAGYATETTYEDVAIDGEGYPRDLVRTLEEGMTALEGIRATATFARDGAALESDIDVPPGADPMISSMMEQIANQAASMTVPLPDEPVGPGAVWEARSTLEINGVASTQATTYTLESIDGDELELAITTDLIMEPGAVAGGEIVSGEGTMAGTTTLSLHQLLPTRSVVEGRTEMVMEVMGQEGTMDMVTQMDMTSAVD